MVSSSDPHALPFRADGSVHSAYLQPGHTIEYSLKTGRGVYLYVLDGGPISLGDLKVPALAAVEVTGNGRLSAEASQDAELLLIEVNLGGERPKA